jgi:uncharacterized protein YjgD (DUF1641 family)
MEADLALLHQKIDLLTRAVAAQSQQIAQLHAQQSGQELLLSKLEGIAQQLEAQRQAQESWKELQQDLVPVANHMIRLSIDELADIGSDFQAEDLLFLVKRLLRDSRLLGELLGRLEAMVELVDDLQVVGNQAFRQAITTMDRMEHDGYFAFARGGWRIAEQIVSEFSEEDVKALGDNIVAILNTVKNLTQPEMMALTNRALGAIQEPAVSDAPVSTLALLRELRDPKTRAGMARLINLLKALAEKPETPPALQ